MKIEIEIDDNIYRLLEGFFGEGVDLGSLLGDVCQVITVMMVTQPEAYAKAFGDNARAELPEPIQNAIKRIADKFIRKAKGEVTENESD